MSNRYVVRSNRAPAAIGPYSQAIVNDGVVYTAGVIPIDPETNQVVEGGIAEQAERVLTSLSRLLEDAGASRETAIKTTCFLQDLGDFAAFNEVYARYFTGDAAPARSTVEVAKLPLGVLVEIECIAAVKA